ncbi:tetratricopeptide repeat protein [Sphingomonas sp. RS6]
MNGWLLFALAALAGGGVLWALRFPRRLWTLPATAVMLAGAGYAWQGQPTLDGRPATGTAAGAWIDPNLIAVREAMFGRFNFDYSYFMAADAMTRTGSPDSAVGVMLGGVRKAPKDAALWTGLGLALAAHDDDQVSPASQFAFDRARALAPSHPGPAFFHGVAFARAGNFGAARREWAVAMRLVPEDASYRMDMVKVIVALDPEILDAAQGQQPQ